MDQTDDSLLSSLNERSVDGGVVVLQPVRHRSPLNMWRTLRRPQLPDVPNLFLCDGSSFVTSGRGQPTMTIQALAFRAAEHLGRFPRRSEI